MKIDKVASVADIILGAWLLLSLLMWRHGSPHLVTSLVVGVGAVVLGALAYLGHTWTRWIVGGLAIWLIVSAWFLEGTSVATVVNAFIVGTLLFGFSVLPTGRGRSIGQSPLRPPVG